MFNREKYPEMRAVALKLHLTLSLICKGRRFAYFSFYISEVVSSSNDFFQPFDTKLQNMAFTGMNIALSTARAICRLDGPGLSGLYLFSAINRILCISYISKYPCSSMPFTLY